MTNIKANTKKAIEKAGFKTYGSMVMINGELFPLPLVQGNEKLGKSVWHASTTPGNGIVTAVIDGVAYEEPGTCPITCKGCYGFCGNFKRYDSARFYIIMRTKLLREYPDVYFTLVRLQIENEDIKKIRIHATGDFIPGEAEEWQKILQDFPTIKAWTYTKVSMNDELKALDALPNMNIVKSIIPGCGFNFGHVPYIAMLYYKLKNAGNSVFICRCGIDKKQHCSDCSGCSDHEYVLFIEHSTGYKAEKDYGFEKLRGLIENQPKQ